MQIKVIVFDFDGTLVYSNEVKYYAYFDLFPDEKKYKAAIKVVLDDYVEESRYFIITKILEELNFKGHIKKEMKKLSDKYSEIVFKGVLESKERDGAEFILNFLSKNYKLFLSSNTTEDSLKEIIKIKGWQKYFINIFGYPRKKAETLRYIIKTEGVLCNEMLVIGDGNSDKESAEKVKCNFIDVNNIKLMDLKSVESINV